MAVLSFYLVLTTDGSSEQVTVPSKMIFFWEEDAEQNSEEESKNCWIEEPREIFFVENKE